MIRSPLGLRLNRVRPLRDQMREAAKLGVRGIVADAAGELAPEQLTETGRREVRHLLRSIDISLIGLHLPTRRSFDTDEQFEDRLTRAERAFSLAYDLGTQLVLARVGQVPPETDTERRAIFTHAVAELGKRADHRGVRLAVETGTESGEALRAVLDPLDPSGLAASIDPGSLVRGGFDPVAVTRALGQWVAHAYASTAASAGDTARSAFYQGPGMARGTIDWQEYLGALEEINYRGYLTIWPDPTADPGQQVQAMIRLFSGF